MEEVRIYLTLPIGEPDPVRQVRAVSRATKLRKNREDARAIQSSRESLSRAPAPVQRALRHIVQGPHEYSLNVSSVPGPRGPIRVLDRRVDAMYSIAEIAPHHALRISALSLEGTLHIGFCADSSVVPDLDALAAGVRISIDELRASLSGPSSIGRVESA